MSNKKKIKAQPADVEDAVVVSEEKGGKVPLYVSYAYTTKEGSSGFGAMVLDTPFGDIKTRSELQACLGALSQKTEFPIITILFWRVLEDA